MKSVILSGGSGTRLWPVSRSSYPKQFCEFFDQSFLENTLDRLAKYGVPAIVTLKSMATLTERGLKRKGMESAAVIYEPMQKNTAPAIGLMCHLAALENQTDQVMGVFPADHLISNEEEFHRITDVAIQEAQKGAVVTLGIRPRSPETGYGYIETESESSGRETRPVKRFHEKPDLDRAKAYVKSPDFFWNAGIFFFRVDTMIEAFKKHEPRLWHSLSQIKADFSNLEYQYAQLPSISIDYAIMERLDNLLCIPSEFGWSDVGSWDEMSRVSDEDKGVQVAGHQQVFEVDSSGNFVYSLQKKVIGLVGMENTLVVDTPDGLLISQKGMSQKVKDLVDQIKQAGSITAVEHGFEWRPWGGFHVLYDGDQFKVKRITVDPGARLSYQRHQRRAEHWVIIEGEAEVILDEKSHILRRNDSITIPQRAKHRIKNIGNQPLIFVEIQTGDYFGEDDIERLQDDYARKV